MQKNNIRILGYILGLILLVVNISACRKFLDVNPRDYIYEDEIFSTREGTFTALNGIYRILANDILYGQRLTMTVADQMAQYYNPRIKNSDLDNSIMNFSYQNPQSKSNFSAIWKSAYKGILNANNFISYVSKPSFNIVEEEEKKLMLGEARAVRAMLHFDMLRLFGPVLTVSADSALAIPYFNKVTIEPQPILAAGDATNKILKDIDTALVLLSNDPIINGVSVKDRNLRMNYYAVKGLQARVLLYAGKNEEAWSSVQPLLPELEKNFPWDGTDVTLADNPLFANEALFVIENRNIYNNFRSLFSSFLSDSTILRQSEERLKNVYSVPQDLRLRKWVKVGSEGNKTYRVFIKYSDGEVENTLQLLQPLIKKSELYLIAAEVAPDVQTGYNFLNALKINRGIPALTPSSSRTQLLADIQLEYTRECWGDGQLFFQFKRWNLSQIPDYTGTATVAMTPEKYMVPLPEDETFYR